MEREEILQKRDELRDYLELNMKNENIQNERIGKIVFYKDFELVDKTEEYYGFTENEVFIVTRDIEQDGQNITVYEIYDENKILLALTDETGKIQYTNNYIDKLKEQAGEYYEEVGIDKRDHYLIREDEFVVAKEPYDKLNEQEKLQEGKEPEERQSQEQEEAKEKEETKDIKKLDEIEPALVENDLGLDKHDILYSTEITDKRFYDKVPEAKQYEGNAMLIYSKKLGTFMIGGMVDGKFQVCDAIEPAKSTFKTSMDLDNNGYPVERDAIHGVMRLKRDPNYDFSIDIEAGGKIEFQELRRDLSTGKYMSADLGTTRQYRASKEVENLMSKQVNHEIGDEIKAFEDEEREGDTADIEDLQEEQDREHR